MRGALSLDSFSGAGSAPGLKPPVLGAGFRWVENPALLPSPSLREGWDAPFSRWEQPAASNVVEQAVGDRFVHLPILAELFLREACGVESLVQGASWMDEAPDFVDLLDGVLGDGLR